MIEIKATPEFGRLPADRPQTLTVAIELRTGAAPDAAPRLPFNLSLVLDRSGSMSGAKLAATKQAAGDLVRRLAASDCVSLVAYDDQVDLLCPPTPGDQKGRLLERVAGLDTRGCTNLSAGWLEGIGQVARGIPREGLNRVLLLTDGQANAGVTDSDALVQMGRRALERGIRTTCLGFGADFNEDLLTAIAEESGGNFYYIDSPDRAAAAFLEELGELGSVIGQNLEVILECEPGVRIARNLTPLPGEVHEARALWKVGDLYADDARLLVVTLELPPGHAGQAPVAQLGVRFHQVRGGVSERRREQPLVVERVAGLAEPDQPDPSVTRERLIQEAAAAKREALARADRGDFAGARRVIDFCSAALRHRVANPGESSQADLERIQSEASVTAALLDELEADRYTSSSRKEVQSQTVQARKQRGAYRRT